jgi:proline-specific peptidase
VKIKEGKIQLKNGYQVWYRRVGCAGRIPLLVLHGGPGSGHDYLEPLEKLAKDRPVIFYDQLGCGKSDRPDGRSLWRMERFLEELDEVREALNLKKVHLFGQSWGGMLAIEYMLTRPQGVASLILADSCASMPQLKKEIKRLMSQLPERIIATLERFEATGDFRNPEYRTAVTEFYKRHVYRLSKIPDCLLHTMENLKDNPVYETMNGPNELVITGNLRDWDRTDQLAKLSVPALILAGRYDEVTPVCSETLHQGLADSQIVIFEESSHLPHIEEQEKYLSTVSGFLSQADSKQVP